MAIISTFLCLRQVSEEKKIGQQSLFQRHTVIMGNNVQTTTYIATPFKLQKSSKMLGTWKILLLQVHSQSSTLTSSELDAITAIQITYFISKLKKNKKCPFAPVHSHALLCNSCASEAHCLIALGCHCKCEYAVVLHNSGQV